MLLTKAYRVCNCLKPVSLQDELSVLALAAKHGDMESVKLLVDNGAIVNVRCQVRWFMYPPRATTCTTCTR